MDVVSKAITDAMKARDQMTSGHAAHAEVGAHHEGGRERARLEPAEDLQVVASMVKQRRDSIEQFTKGSRLDLAEKETQEIAILERFQPPAASADEIAAAVEAGRRLDTGASLRRTSAR